MRHSHGHEQALALEILVGLLYSKTAVYRLSDATVQAFSSQTAVLNLLLMLASDHSQTASAKQISHMDFPLAAFHIARHLAKRNIEGGDRFAVDSSDVKMRETLEIRGLTICNPNTGRISRHPFLRFLLSP